MGTNFFEFQAKVSRPRSARALAGEPATSRDGAEARPLTVAELTSKIEKALKGGLPASVLVQGEVSNFNRNKSSGHAYFTLKDADACIDCVMFRSEAIRLKFEPRDGMELLAGGRIGVYPQRGRYQLYVGTLRPLGQGALEVAFQQMRAKLEAEGLFAPERKKPLPPYPRRIVIVTSREAAALHDMLKVLRRFPWLRLHVYHVPVQGSGAAEKIADALTHLNASPNRFDGADMILLGRGGGSLEDLWSFNEEVVARAIVASHIPIVTGIGHEVDVSIADLVADHHAHTPTEAAQVVTAFWRGIEDHLETTDQRLQRSFRSAVADARQRLRHVERHEVFRRPLDRINSLRQLLDDRQRALALAATGRVGEMRRRVQEAGPRLERYLPAVLLRLRDRLGSRRQQFDQILALRLRRARERLARAEGLLTECHPRHGMQLKSQHLTMLQERMTRAATGEMARRKLLLEGLATHLNAVSPRAVLRRGYTMTTRRKDGISLRSAKELKPGERIVTHFSDGQVESTVEDAKQLPLFE